MKKLIVIVSLLVFAMLSYSQDITVTGLKASVDAFIDVSGSTNESYIYKYPSESADTLIESETWNFDIGILKDYSTDLKYEARVALDSISGTPSLNIILQGKYSWNDSYTSLDTVAWAGTSSDTTAVFTYSTAKNYRFVNIAIVADATDQKVQVERIEFGVYD
jgi:hypothetical protein